MPGCVVLPPGLSSSEETEYVQIDTQAVEKTDAAYTPEKNLKIHPHVQAREEIHRSILAFPDRYMERIAQVSDQFIASEITPMDREFIQSMRVAYVTSAIAIAT